MVKLRAMYEELMDYSDLMTLGSEKVRERDRRRYPQALWNLQNENFLVPFNMLPVADCGPWTTHWQVMNQHKSKLDNCVSYN